MDTVANAVALAKLYLQSSDEESALKVMDQIKSKLTSETKIGLFNRMLIADIHLDRGDYEKVEESIIEMDILIKELGLKMIESRKNKISAQLHEKKGDFKNALDYYQASMHESPG